MLSKVRIVQQDESYSVNHVRMARVVHEVQIVTNIAVFAILRARKAPIAVLPTCFC